MATPKIWWLLSILLVTLPDCCPAAGPPAPPSLSECYIPLSDEEDGSVHCIWDQRPDSEIHTKYILHWQPVNNEDGHLTSGTSLNGRIPRDSFPTDGQLRVWVQAVNEHGSAKSQAFVFNTQNIKKPPPPKFTLSDEEPLEVHWNTACDQLEQSIGPCDLRYRTEEDKVWLEHEGGFHGSYTFEEPQPGTVYEIQVRCACHTGLMSDWSEIERIKSAESTPVGQVDVWWDCGMPPTSSDCFLTWKNLSISQACGLILGYEIRVSYNNGTVEPMNVSTAEPNSQFVYNETKWRLTSSLKDVSSVSVSAYNALGATVPSCLLMPITGKEDNDRVIYLNMTEENLTVSLDLPSQYSDNLKEYVVQYKRAGCSPGQGFDWIKVNKSQTTGFFKGHFKKYTPYQVSLFTVSLDGEVHQLSSRIGYSLQRAPTAVPSFKVFSIGATDVTLLWEPVPLSKQNGLILYYQIGVGTQKVYNVSAPQQHEIKTYKLLHLSPGQEYEVWIRAVTVAGPGANFTRRFTTTDNENFAYISLVLLGFVLLVSIIFVLFSTFRGENKVCPLVPQWFNQKVPDPRNSQIFRQIKHQINVPLTWTCTPVEEEPKISLLEVVEMKSQALKADRLTRPVVGDGCSQMRCQDDQRGDTVTEECDRTDHRREEYSKMVDSDEERDDCCSSSEEEQFTSGYEKHFMPTALEILEV